MITRFLAGTILLLAAGCQSPKPTVEKPKAVAWSPIDALVRAAEAAPSGISGVFEMKIQATGEQDGFAYLNSELDYRDQRNLTIAIPAGPRRTLTALNGMDPKSFYAGKRVRVTGEAKRTTIYFYSNGIRSSKYYFQTHVTIYDPKQIEIVE